MDLQIIRGIVEAVRRSEQVIGIDNVFTEYVASIESKIPPVKIGKHAQVME